MKYDVHLFAVVRVKVAGIEAPNEISAAKEANHRVNMNSIFNTAEGKVSNPYVSETEFDDTITHILVESADNGQRNPPKGASCYEPFGKGGLTAVPFDRVSTHVAVIVDGGNVQSVVTSRPCQVSILDHDHAEDPNYHMDEDTAFHDSEVDPWLRCQHEFQNQYRRRKSA